MKGDLLSLHPASLGRSSLDDLLPAQDLGWDCEASGSWCSPALLLNSSCGDWQHPPGAPSDYQNNSCLQAPNCVTSTNVCPFRHVFWVVLVGGCSLWPAKQSWQQSLERHLLYIPITEVEGVTDGCFPRASIGSVLLVYINWSEIRWLVDSLIRQEQQLLCALAATLGQTPSRHHSWKSLYQIKIAGMSIGVEPVGCGSH